MAGVIVVEEGGPALLTLDPVLLGVHLVSGVAVRPPRSPLHSAGWN